MSSRVAAFIVNYNMPERADALAERVLESQWPVNLYVIDNGSDLVEPSRYTNVRLKNNVQTTGGWFAGLRAADASGIDYMAYWFIITSAEYVDNKDILTPMARFMYDTPEAVVVHPALTKDSTTIWHHMKDRGSGKPRRVWYCDQIAVLYRADWYNSIGRWDEDLIYAHGIGLEACYKARMQERSIWIHEGCQIKKVTDIGYTMDRMRMSADERRRRAKRNMDVVLGNRYGVNYWQFLTNEGVQEEWR